jgi:carboxypeptidase family protein
MVTSKGRSLSALPRLAVAGIIGLIALGNGLVFGQSAALIGTVKDMSGAALPGAAVTVKHVDTGQTRTAQADASGSFSVQSLPVGQYEVTAEKMGFRKEIRSGINLAVAQQAVVDLTLQVGSIDQQVTVTGEAPLVNTTLSSTAGLISEQQVKDLPLNGRSFDQLLTLNTGVVNNSSNMGQGNGFTNFSVAGKRQETNRFLINGVDWVGGNATAQFITPSGASGLLLGVEAIREFNALEHTYGAEYGKRAGGQISIVTQSGTNQLHGSAFEYLRNSFFDARNFFEQTIGPGPFKRNQFGGALGGPIKKDKLFLYGTYEGFQQRLAQSTRAIVPDLFARQGMLPCKVIGGPTANACPASGYALVPNLKAGILPYVQNFYPAPNGPEVPGALTGTAYNYNNAVEPRHENFGLVRFDYIISQKDTFSANYTLDDGERDVPQPNANFIQIIPLRAQTLGLQETHVISPTMVNSLTLGYARPSAGQVNAPAVTIPSNLLFLAGGNPGSITIGGGATTVAPSAVVAANGINPLTGIREYYTAADDVRWTKGKHSFSAGGWFQRLHSNVFGSAQFSAGGISYTNMLNFLTDVPSQFNLNRNPVPVGFRSTEGAWYVQDEIKLRSNLTMRIGLRDEFTNGWNEVAGRCSSYAWDANFVMVTNPVIGNSCLSSNQAKALWQPRVGIAWDPTGDGKWAVRAGFGIHNDLQDNLANRTYANPPFNARELLDVSKGLLSLPLPLSKNAVLPPTCTDQLRAAGTLCSIYSPAGVDPNLFTPTILQWSFTVERELTRDLMLSVGYVGSQSYHTPLSENINTAAPLVCANSLGCVSGGSTTAGVAVPVVQRGLVPLGALYMAPGLRPNPNIGNGVTWVDQGTSSYHSLNVSFTKRASHGLTFKANYTYAKVIDLNSAILAPSAGNEPPDVFSPYHLSMNRGVGSYSLQHQFGANFSYQLPFGHGQQFGNAAHGFVDKVIGGWQLNGIVTALGGFPFTPLAGSNTSGTGDANQSDTPNWNPNFTGPVILGGPNQYFDPRAFLIPTQGTFGNVSRGSLRGPGLADFDTSLFKKIPINERFNLQFRAEVFNLFNHANFAYPNEIIFSGNTCSAGVGPVCSANNISSSAGAVNNTATFSRQIQLALKLTF